MSLDRIEATFKAQTDALLIAQRCQDQLHEQLKELMTQRHGASHMSHTEEQSKRHKQDITTIPVDQAVSGRLGQRELDPDEDLHTDEDLIQALQDYEKERQQGTGHQLLHDKSIVPAQMSHSTTPYPAGHQHNTVHHPGEQPPLPVAGLRAFHLCTARHSDGRYSCRKLLPYPRSLSPGPSTSTHQFGNDILVEFWLAGIQHFCISPIPTLASYQEAARQLGASSHLVHCTETRLRRSTAPNTLERYGAPANSELVIYSNHNYFIGPELTRHAFAQLTWEEIVLAHNTARTSQ